MNAWRISLGLGLVTAVFIGVGCASREAAAPSPKPFGPTGIPPQLRGKGASGGTPVTPGGNVDAAGGNQPQFTPEEEIVYTDPDADDQESPEVAEILSKAKRSDAWELSESVARKRAQREGKPLLIWFTDSKQSPLCKTLSRELFSRPDFEAWAQDQVIRLRVDANPSLDIPGRSLEQMETMRVDVRRYVAEMKKRYKVMGHPAVLMLDPAGGVTGRFQGYRRGEAEFFWGQLKHAVTVAKRVDGEFRQKLAAQGYRQWTSRTGKSVYARLVRYRGGVLQLVEPDGTLSQTQLGQLGDADREWIQEQLKQRQQQ